MKIISGLILASSLLIASSFEQDVDYVCQNTAVVEGGEKTELDMSKSLGMPFSFTIKGKRLTFHWLGKQKGIKLTWN